MEDRNVELWNLFLENGTFLYYISNRGRIERKNKKTGTSMPIRTHFVKSFQKVKEGYGGYERALILGKEYRIHSLIAKYFLKGYKGDNSQVLVFKDGNPRHCTADNIIIVHRKYAFAYHVRKALRKPILVTEKGKRTVFNSLKEASKYIGCSRQSLSMYLTQKRPNLLMTEKGIKAEYYRGK